MIDMAKNKNSPPSFHGKDFDDYSDLTRIEKMRLVVRSPYDIRRNIKDWNGKPAVASYVTLSQDNSSVERCSVHLLGNLLEDCHAEVDLINGWESSSDISVHFGVIKEGTFKFQPGSLASDLVDSSRLDYYCKIGNQRLDGSSQFGYTNVKFNCTKSNQNFNPTKGFTVRAYIVPTDTKYAWLTLVLYPLSLLELQTQYPLSSDPRFPGIKLYSEHVPLEIKAEPFLNRNWESSILPAIIRSSWSPNLPAADNMRAAVATTLRTAIQPECLPSYAALIPRWKDIRVEGMEHLRSMPLEAVWPEHTVKLSTGKIPLKYLK